MTKTRRFFAAAAITGLFFTPLSAAQAHNHINPSGACNQSPDGADGPGNTSGITNPGNGRVIAETQAGPVAQGDENCTRP